MSETIYFNGKKYNSVAEMPSNVRQLYEKLECSSTVRKTQSIYDRRESRWRSGYRPNRRVGRDKTVNMIKDIAQISNTEGFEPGQMSLVRVTDSNIYINGKEFSSSGEMPDHIRQEYEKIIENSQDGTEDIFDESWRQVDRAKYFEPHDDEILNQKFSKQVSNFDAPIQTVDSTGRFIMIAAVAILIFGCLAAAWFLLL